jgi:dipeptidyl aminopeptidase
MESTSTTSLILERIHPGGRTTAGPSDAPPDKEEGNYSDEEDGEDADLESGGFLPHQKPLEKKVRRSVYIIGALLVSAWLLSLIVYLSRGHYKAQDVPHDPSATATAKAGKTITMDMIMGGSFRAQKKNIEWIPGSNGEDGLMLVQGGNTGYLEVQDSRNTSDVRVLMQEETLRYGDQRVSVRKVWPSPDLKKVLVASEVQNVRPIALPHFYAQY